MADWATLRHAYGRATDIPALIDAWAEAPTQAQLIELWSRLCHQGTVYSASFEALPLLAQACSRLAPTDRQSALMLMAAIWASDDHCGGATPREAIAELMPTLQKMTEACMNDADIDEKAFVYLLQAAASFRGDLFWGRYFDGSADGEFSGVCPRCETSLYIAVGQDGYFAAVEDWVSNKSAQRVPITPSVENQLPPDGAWLFQQAKRHARDGIARDVAHIFGLVSCLNCSATISVVDAIRRAAGV